MEELVFSPSDFVAVFNQTLEYAYPKVVIEGELTELRVSKNRWVYFSLKDEQASVKFFGAREQLPGPLEDGLKVRASGVPRLHPRYGFSLNLVSVVPVGEGSLKKAADALAKKLAGEGLFDPRRKRPLPALPQVIGLITADGSAAAADFIKILGERWGGLEIWLHDAYVQGERAAASLTAAIDYFNRVAMVPDVLVITRGGGSADELSVFNDERVVRAVAASRVPTMVAIGHEVDISLAELAADARASTPSNAAQLLVPDKKPILAEFDNTRAALKKALLGGLDTKAQALERSREYLTSQALQLLKNQRSQLVSLRKLARVFDPNLALRRGYAIVSKAGRHVSRTGQVKLGDRLSVELSDGTINASVTGK